MGTTVKTKPRAFASTRNSCKLCAPLGAAVAFRGIEGCVPLVHGSQGCSTYIRRYVISHFREPIDVASSNFTESSAVFGGGENLAKALDNVTSQYAPGAIGIASTCLSETMGEDVSMHLRQYRASRGSSAPTVFNASTPSYRGTHVDGFHEAVYAAVTALCPPISACPPGLPAETAALATGAARAAEEGRNPSINVFPGFVSAEDIREIKSILAAFGAKGTVMPDYSDSLDGESWAEYSRLPEGGTPLEAIAAMSRSAGSLQLGTAIPEGRDAAAYLERAFAVPAERCGLPIGIDATDRFMDAIVRITGAKVPREIERQRGRLVDAYVDGHKYLFGKRAIVYGDEDFAVALAGFLSEIGVVPTLVVTGASSARFRERVAAACVGTRETVIAMEDSDFASALEAAREARPDIAIGNSKGLYVTRELGIPLVRCGFPIHDRMGAQRVLHLGYRGTTGLFDRVCNALMRESQDRAKSGYTYI
jgi:nitrogenase molybdenum-iron protein NifN